MAVPVGVSEFGVAPPPPGFGFPGPGIGGGLNLDVGGGLGLPGLLGGLPGWTGWAGPYVPITPLGALGGFKGDLIVPIVAIGVAVFLLVIIVMAVKYALIWKLGVLEDLAGPKRFRREVGDAPAPQLETDYLNQLARVVISAIYSGECADRMICEVGSYARGNVRVLDTIISLVESYIPMPFKTYLDIMRESAAGTYDCAQKHQCGQQQGQSRQPSSAIPNTQQQPQSPLNIQAQTPRPDIKEIFNATGNELKPKMNKFRRHI